MLRLVLSLVVMVAVAQCATGDTPDTVNMGPSGDKDTTDTEPKEPGAVGCYVCNSKFDDGCDDEFDRKSSYAQEYYKDCRAVFGDYNDTIQVVPEDINNATYYCTKTKITFEFSGIYEEPRIIRDCGYGPGRYGWAGCYYTASNLYNTAVCKCEEDDCNSATSLASTLFVFVTGLLMFR